MSVKSFLIGLLLGASLVAGFGVFAANEPPKIVGDSGRLDGLEITGMDGKRVCHNPWYHKANQVIACEQPKTKYMLNECERCGVSIALGATFCYACGNAMPKRSPGIPTPQVAAPPITAPAITITQTPTELRLDCSACKTSSVMTATKIDRFSAILRIIGGLLVVPSFLGIGAGGLMVITALAAGSNISNTANSSAQTGAALGMGIGFTVGVSIALVSLISGAAGWVFLLTRNVWKCERCGYFLDRA